MANLNVNKVIIGGRLTSNPEVKTTTSGVPVCSFTIAVNRRDKEQGADFFNCQAWRSQAELLGKYFKKGSSIFLVGELKNRSWEDKEGNKRTVTEIVASEISFVDSKNDAQGTEASSPSKYMPEAYKTSQNANFEGVETDSDLPF
jgi:single-strand DNA-binding protein